MKQRFQKLFFKAIEMIVLKTIVALLRKLLDYLI